LLAAAVTAQVKGRLADQLQAALADERLEHGPGRCLAPGPPNPAGSDGS
jgi:hypothetical protein